MINISFIAKRYDSPFFPAEIPRMLGQIQDILSHTLLATATPLVISDHCIKEINKPYESLNQTKYEEYRHIWY